MSFRIATAFVDVKADDDGLREDIAAKVKAAAESIEARVKVAADAEAVQAEVKTAAEAADAEATVKVKADAAEVPAEVKAAADSVEATVKVKADTEAVPEEVKAAAEAAHAEAHVTVKVDEGASGFEAEFRKAMAEGEQAADAAAHDLRDSYTAVINASEALRDSVDDAGQAAEDAGSKLDNAGKKAGNSKSSLDQLKSAAESTGSALRIISMISLAPSLGAIPGIAAGAVGGLLTLALGLGDVVKALRDAGQASSAMGQSGAQLALTAFNNAVAIRNANQAIVDAERTAAQQAIASAESIANAKRGVADAVRQAAQQQISSAEQVANAQQSLGDAVRQAAISQENSYDSIVSAQQRATAAAVTQAQAQRDLTLAQQDAVNTIADLRNANADAALSQQAAQLALQQAIRNNTATQANSLDTDLQKQQSALAVAQAQQAVVDAQQRSKEAQQAADRANSETASGLPAVVQAQQKLTDSIIATADANHAVAIADRDAANQQISSREQIGNAEQRLADAQRQQANQQISSAEQVANAQRQLADAVRQAQQQQISSAEQVAKAKQALIDLEEQQKLAAAAAAASSATAANQFAKDYAKLTPAGKAFVDQVLSMRSAFHGLEADAQNAMLPGFTTMLKDTSNLLPTVQLGVERTGKAFGDTAIAFGNLFANPQFDAAASQFTQLVTGGFGQFLSALPPLLDSVVTQGVRAVPLINAVALGMHDLIATGLPNFLDGLNRQASDAAQGVGALFGAVNGLLGPVGTLVGALAGAAGPALATLEPEVIKAADAIEADLLPLMPQLSTDLVDVARVADQLLQILEPIIPVIADGLGTGLRVIDPLLKDTAQFLQENQRWLTPVAEGFLAVYAAVKLYGGVSSIAKKAIGTITDGLGAFSRGAETAAGKAGSVANALGGTEGLATKLGIVGAVTGGVAAGIVGVGEALNHMIYSGSEAATSVDQFTEAMLRSESPTADATAKFDSYSKLSRALGSNAPGVTDALAQTGLGMIKLAAVTGTTNDDLKNFDAGLAALVSNGNADRARAIVAQLATATDAHGKKILDANKLLPQYETELEKTSVQAQASARAAQNNADATRNLGDATTVTKDKFQAMSATMSQSEALDRFHAQLLDLKSAADQNGTSLDGNTAAGLRNRQAFSDLADQIREYGQKLRDSGDSNTDAAKHMQDMIGQLEGQAGQFGYSKDQVDAYIKKLGLVPSSVVTKLETQIVAEINQSVLAATIDEIINVTDNIIGQRASHNTGGRPLQNAGGGLITGPGSGTSDSILSRVSNGEFIVQASVVQQPGVLAALTALNNGTGGGVPVQQVGGTTPQPAAPTITLNYYGTQQPTPEQQQNMMNELALAVRH